MCICKKVRKKLEFEADEKYKKFSASLLPGVDNILGVRLPLLRKIAKEIYKTGWQAFLDAETKYMEETMLKGMVTGLLKETDSDIPAAIEKFIPEIKNWSVCDSFCCSLKYTKTHEKAIWRLAEKYAGSEKEFEQRFSYVIMLNYFVKEEYLDKIFRLVNDFRSEYYYAQMAVAWLISVCFAKYPEKTTEFLENTVLDKFTYNKSIQKICESYRVDKATKQKLKLTKRQF